MTQHNPLLDRIVLPGETFKLPSLGLFYNDGELADSVEHAEVHVYPMTAQDEIIMRSPDNLFSGKAIRQVFARCIPDVLKPEELLSKDVDFLVTCLRKVSYGQGYEVEFQHTCEGSKSYTYSIDLSNIIQTQTKYVNPTTKNQMFNVLLDNKQVVQTIPIKYKDVITLLQYQQRTDITDEELQEISINSLLGIIYSVDEIVDKTLILEWLKKIPVKWAHQIEDTITASDDWGVNFKSHVQCKDCGQNVEVTTLVNPLSFFF